MIIDKNPHHLKLTDEELERMYVSYMKRTYQGRTINSGTHIQSFEEFKKQMKETKFITLKISWK